MADAPDATAAEALRSGQPVRAVELTGAGPTDSDLAAPIVLDGVAVGVLVVRGVSRMGAAALPRSGRRRRGGWRWPSKGTHRPRAAAP